MTIILVDKDAQAGAAINGIIIVDVDAADGLPIFSQVNHQAELLLGRNVIVAQQKLLNLEAGVGDMRPAHPPDVAVVLPPIDAFGILRLGIAQRYRIVIDKHLLQFIEKTMVYMQIGT